jgi:hypothetical protein
LTGIAIEALVGLGLLALTVAKVFFVDLAKLESIWRVGSFLAAASCSSRGRVRLPEESRSVAA